MFRPIPLGARRLPFRHGLVACLLALVTLGAALAQGAAGDDDNSLDKLRQQLDTVQRALRAPDALDDTELQKLRRDALGVQSAAGSTAARLAPDLASLDQRISQLGTPAPGTREDAEVATTRAQLGKSRSQIDGQLKVARLLAVEADQLQARLGTLRRSGFQARLGERTASILSAPFWSDLRDDAPTDAGRLAALGDQLAVSARRTPPGAWIGVPLATALAGWALWWAMRRLVRWLQTRAPAGRLRRSLHAVVSVVEWTVSFGLVAVAAQALVDWRHVLPEGPTTLLSNLVGVIWFGGFVYGLMKALICAGRPSWRLLPIPDPVAASLAWFPALITLASLASWLAERLTALVDASLSLTVAVNCVVALAMGLTVGLTLIRGERLWRRELAAQDGKRRPLWLAAVGVASWVLLGIAVISLLAGFVALGSFVVKQVVWSGIVLGAAYLLAALIDDGLMAWLAQAPTEHDAPAAGPSAAATKAPPISAQFAVLASGLLRFSVLLVALMLLLAPFGDGPVDLLRRGGQWQQGLSIGEVRLQPGAVLQALAVLLVGLGVVRLLRRWLTDRYLPTTSLDAGMQASTTSLFGYLGVIVAIAIAMSALGIGLERIAWVASALSVGIGFGLQAVVQNFVSGLILLAERPVKVGDWVSLGGVEGDIRRINVRATEIQQGDRSTVIVPNSEFITKTVRNVTLENPLGLVQLKLPLPLSTDAEQVRTLLLEIFQANGDLVESPAPSVALDGIDGGQLVFNATGFADSPRKTYGIRSALLFEVLKRFAAEGIALAKPPTMLLQNPTAPAGSSEGG